MVILQFNKLIRNKWIWGVFAVAISIFFAFDFIIADLGRDEGPSKGHAAGLLAGKPVDSAHFLSLVEEARGFGRNYSEDSKRAEFNLMAWKTLAALSAAEQNGLAVSLADIQSEILRDPSFQLNGAFNFNAYQRILMDNGLTTDRYEASLKRRLALSHITRTLVDSAAWVSPLEVQQAVSDMTDRFTVRVARFAQSAKDAEAVMLDEDGLRKWYDDNQSSIELPERAKIRFVRFSATATNVLAKMTVSEAEIQDRFDSTCENYKVKDTNGVETVKKYEQLTPAEKAGIERELRQMAAINYYETNLNARVYAQESTSGLSRLDEIAKEEGLKVETSAWFATDGSYVEGFMSRATAICPGAQGFLEAVAELDPESKDLRYGVISSSRAVWLIEKAEISAKHLPSFDEAKEPIRPRALRDAKAAAFKSAVMAVAAKGAEAVLATENVSTNIVFSALDLNRGSFPDQMAIAQAATKLYKGEVSDFTLTRPGNALLVVCMDRQEGDMAAAMAYRSRISSDVAMLQKRQLPMAWQTWNLENMKFETEAISSVKNESSEVQAD